LFGGVVVPFVYIEKYSFQERIEGVVIRKFSQPSYRYPTVLVINYKKYKT
jgi:hypothetical protein